MTEKQLIELLGKWGAAIRDAILVGIRDIRDNARLTEIIRMIEQNNVEGALRALGYDPAVFNTYYTMMVQAFEEGGMMLMMSQPRSTADATGVQTMLRFIVRNPDAEKWLREQSSSLVTNIGEDVREAVRSTLDEGMREGRNPRSVALELVGRYDRSTGHREGGVVGLGAREQFWSRSVRQKLLTLDASYFDMALRDKRFDATVRAAIESGTPLSAETVQRLTDRYRAKALQFRGETIGRTEALGALNRSQYEATRQALEQSGLPPAAAHKVWKSAKDSRVRHSHREMHNQRVGIDEPFVSPDTGARLMHPHDSSLGAPAREIIDCRCRVDFDIDYGYGVE